LNRLLEFTLRLGSANAQCYGTSQTDPNREMKSILLLSSCSNGVHWNIIDLFRISDILAPDFGFSSFIKSFNFRLIIFFCLIERLVEFYLKRKSRVKIALLNGDK
jgi:hypothetical protein